MRNCYAICKGSEALSKMNSELKTLLNMMDSVGKLETQDWEEFPYPYNP